MDAKGKKIHTCLTKNGDQDVFDISIAVKMDEDAVAKILESLEKEGLVSSVTNDKGTAIYSAIKAPAPEKAAKPEKIKPEKAEKIDKTDTLDDIDDDDDDAPGKSGGAGGMLPVIIVGALAVALFVVALIVGGNAAGGAKKEAEAAAAQVTAVRAELETFKSEANGKIDALTAKVDSLGLIVSDLRRRPAGGPPAARPQQRRR